MRYILRRVIFEDSAREQTEELIRLCRNAGIDEVLLMEQSHMALMVPYPIEKHRRMAEKYRMIGKKLRENGIGYGINVASIAGHTDADVSGEYRLPFQKFVGDDLKEACSCYCILDEKWQEYAGNVFSEYARTEPDCIFIDDDFRSLNHGRTLGCFCPVHIRKTEEKLNEQYGESGNFEGLTEETVLNSLSACDGRSLRIRRAWMQVNFEGQKKAAAYIRECVKRISPRTRVGLMSPDERKHSVQGRRIGELLACLTGEGERALYRPSGDTYGDGIHSAVFGAHQVMALTLSQLTAPVQIVSEFEIFPHTRYTSSIRCDVLTMKMQALAGAEDISLNLYDYLGNPLEREPLYEKMLKDNREILEEICRLRKNKKLKGFGLPFHIRESEYRVYRGGDMNTLYPNRILDRMLPAMGIPVQFEAAEGNAILGSAFWCYTDEEILEFLHGGLLTDAQGAQILWKRGFGEYIGCRAVLTGEIPAMERIVDREFGGAFYQDYMQTNWFRHPSDERYRLIPQEGARVITEIVDLERAPLWPGMVLYENKAGGRTAVVSTIPEPDTWYFRNRAAVILQTVRWLMFDALPVAVEDAPDVGPIYYENEETGEGLLAVASGSLDASSYSLRTNGIHLVESLDGAKEEFRTEGMSVRFWKTCRTGG